MRNPLQEVVVFVVREYHSCHFRSVGEKPQQIIDTQKLSDFIQPIRALVEEKIRLYYPGFFFPSTVE